MHITTADPQSRQTAGATDGSDNTALASVPGQLQVIKRNGAVVPYDESKIYVAMMKAFIAVEGSNAAASNRIHETVTQLSNGITATFHRRLSTGGTIHIEEIQDQVELVLMRSGDHKVARSYVLYREARAQERAAARQLLENTPLEAAAAQQLSVRHSDGQLRPLDTVRLSSVVQEACSGLTDVDATCVITETLRNLYARARHRQSL